MNAPPPPVLSGKSRACQGLLRWSVDIIVCLGAMVNCFFGAHFRCTDLQDGVGIPLFFCKVIFILSDN